MRATHVSSFVIECLLVTGGPGSLITDYITVMLLTDHLPPSSFPSFQIPNHPSPAVSLLHYSITPSLHHSITPLLHHSIAPLLHYSITPLLHHSIAPLLHHSIAVLHPCHRCNPRLKIPKPPFISC